MRQRCKNCKCRNYKNYGAKGITVCEEWDDPVVFAKWAYENGYDDSLTIDRIDVTKGYYPENCRWTTYKKQANNKSNNRRIRCGNEVHTLGEWSEITGISISTIYARLKYGWTEEDAVKKKLWENNTRYKESVLSVEKR